MNKYNIVWAIVDSVRKYHSNDDRTRLKFMDEFAKNSIEFLNVVTSAPSTVMSISAMMTSLPSYYIGRNYSDFRFDNEYFTTLSEILKSNNYETRALIMHKEIREKLRVFDLIKKKYWPRNFSHSKWWDNKMIYSLLKNSLEIDNGLYEKPVFWFLDFNCRKDKQTSNIVKNSFTLLNKYGFNEDNTIFILCSDHGYPDPRRGITPEELKRKGLTHDIFMTDDNITIPLFIKYPNCKRGYKFKNTISTLDLMPTVLDILDIKVESKIKNNWHGQSLIPYINKNKNYPERIIRTDARFLGQSGRVSALRNDKFKFIYYHDTSKSEFYDVSKFRLNEKKLSIKTQYHLKELKKFKNTFLYQENKAVKFQVNYLAFKLKKQIGKLNIKQKDRILILIENIGSLSNSIRTSFSLIFDNNPIDLIDVNNKKIISLEKKYFIKKYALLIQIDNSDEKIHQINTKEIINKIKFNKKIVMDINMNISVRKGELFRYLKTLYINREFYFQEPILFYYEFIRIIKIIKSRIYSV